MPSIPRILKKMLRPSVMLNFVMLSAIMLNALYVLLQYPWALTAIWTYVPSFKNLRKLNRFECTIWRCRRWSWGTLSKLIWCLYHRVQPRSSGDWRSYWQLKVNHWLGRWWLLIRGGIGVVDGWNRQRVRPHVIGFSDWSTRWRQPSIGWSIHSHGKRRSARSHRQDIQPQPRCWWWKGWSLGKRCCRGMINCPLSIGRFRLRWLLQSRRWWKALGWWEG